MGFIIYWQKKYFAALYFYSLGIEYIPQKTLHEIKDKLITHNSFKTQDNESIMCWFYCIAFSEFLVAGKNFLDYTESFLPNDYKKNDNST